MKYSKSKFLSSLKEFTGTENYYKISPFSNLKLTDGMKFVCDSLKCYWLVDICVSVQNLQKIKDNDFILWTIKVKDKSAVVKALSDSEGVGEVLYEQEVKYTDFPLDEFEFYQCGDVLLLKEEY